MRKQPPPYKLVVIRNSLAEVRVISAATVDRSGGRAYPVLLALGRKEG